MMYFTGSAQISYTDVGRLEMGCWDKSPQEACDRLKTALDERGYKIWQGADQWPAIIGQNLHGSSSKNAIVALDTA